MTLKSSQAGVESWLDQRAANFKVTSYGQILSNTWNPDDYNRYARFVPEFGLQLISLLALQPGERILDLGCGNGTLTKVLAESGCSVLGVDAGADMVQAARALGRDACVMDGQSLAFENAFDAVFSNAALHWMPSPRGVACEVNRTLKSGGRFVGEMGGQGNIAALVKLMAQTFAAHPEFGAFKNPWYFPSTDVYRAILEKAGFKVNGMALIKRPTKLPGDIREWLITFTSGITAKLADA
jgi:trans-aconitate methyltransferase